jgi:hypothetical protein
LVTPFEETDAYKLGLIDSNGKRIKSQDLTTDERRNALTSFHKLAFNIKKLLAKAPGGSSKLASYAAALYLIKDNYNLSDKNLDKILKECNIDKLDLLESQHQWYMLSENVISPGIYRLRNEKLLSETLDDVVNEKDKIRILENCSPIDNMFGINIYEGIHINTGQKVHFTTGEIYK